MWEEWRDLRGSILVTSPICRPLLYSCGRDNRVSFLSNYCPFCSLLLLTQERYIVVVSVVVCAWVGEAVSCEDVGGYSEKT